MPHGQMGGGMASRASITGSYYPLLEDLECRPGAQGVPSTR
ncbi:hypothetical protein MY11210_001323 [Beauveria gryllotalpidicola]